MTGLLMIIALVLAVVDAVVVLYAVLLQFDMVYELRRLIAGLMRDRDEHTPKVVEYWDASRRDD